MEEIEAGMQESLKRGEKILPEIYEAIFQELTPIKSDGGGGGVKTVATPDGTISLLLAKERDIIRRRLDASGYQPRAYAQKVIGDQHRFRQLLQSAPNRQDHRDRHRQ